MRLLQAGAERHIKVYLDALLEYIPVLARAWVKRSLSSKVEVCAYKEGRASPETEVTFGVSMGVTGIPLQSINWLSTASDSGFCKDSRGVHRQADKDTNHAVGESLYRKKKLVLTGRR